MRKVFKSYVLVKVIPACIILVAILIGIIKVDIINTKSLSPLGNTNENYQLVSEEFGEDFSNFIKDNSYLKIYTEEGENILVKLGDKQFQITNQSIFIKQIEDAVKNVGNGFKEVKETIGKLL